MADRKALVIGDTGKLEQLQTGDSITPELDLEIAKFREIFRDTNEPTGFIREYPETMGVIELCVDGTKVISVDEDGVVTIRNDGLFADGSVANAREFAISPVVYPKAGSDIRDVTINGGNYYSIYVEGTKTNIQTTQKITFPNQSGLQYVYHSLGGTLALATTFSFDYFEDRPITCTVYGNATTQELVNFGDERHGIQMDGFTHRYLHFTQGTQYVDGMEIQGLTDGGTTYTQITSGSAYDEDIYMSPLAQTDAPFVWRDGSFWTVQPDSLDISYQVGGVTQFNCDTNYVNYGVAGVDYTPSGIYELRDVTGDDAMIMFFVLTNNKEFPYTKILGQKVYNKVSDARSDVNESINNLILSGLPSPEFLPIGAVIVRGDGTLQLLDDGSLYLDLRATKFSGAGTTSGSTISHNDLLDRSLPNQHPISSITGLEAIVDELQATTATIDGGSANSISTISEILDGGDA